MWEAPCFCYQKGALGNCVDDESMTAKYIMYMALLVMDLETV